MEILKMKKYIVDDTYRDEITKFESYDDAIDYCNEQEIIYYHVAMNYLIENDCSLYDSIQSCVDMGMELDGINSETLANVHYQDALINSIKEIS
jgi:hypothetical protein